MNRQYNYILQKTKIVNSLTEEITEFKKITGSYPTKAQVIFALNEALGVNLLIEETDNTAIKSSDLGNIIDSLYTLNEGPVGQLIARGAKYLIPRILPFLMSTAPALEAEAGTAASTALRGTTARMVSTELGAAQRAAAVGSLERTAATEVGGAVHTMNVGDAARGLRSGASTETQAVTKTVTAKPTTTEAPPPIQTPTQTSTPAKISATTSAEASAATKTAQTAAKESSVVGAGAKPVAKPIETTPTNTAAKPTETANTAAKATNTAAKATETTNTAGKATNTAAKATETTNTAGKATNTAAKATETTNTAGKATETGNFVTKIIDTAKSAIGKVAALGGAIVAGAAAAGGGGGAAVPPGSGGDATVSPEEKYPGFKYGEEERLKAIRSFAVKGQNGWTEQQELTETKNWLSLLETKLSASESAKRKAEKQKYKIVYMQDGKKVEVFASSIRGVRRAAYGKNQFRVFDSKGSDVTSYFKRLMSEKK